MPINMNSVSDRFRDKRLEDIQLAMPEKKSTDIDLKAPWKGE
jgi:hypothetical protein